MNRAHKIKRRTKSEGIYEGKGLPSTDGRPLIIYLNNLFNK